MKVKGRLIGNCCEHCPNAFGELAGESLIIFFSKRLFLTTLVSFKILHKGLINLFLPNVVPELRLLNVSRQKGPTTIRWGFFFQLK